MTEHVHSTKHVVVIGGGITGLAAARRLAAHVPDVRVTLVESDKQLGGKIVTERVDGFVIEGGPDSFLSRKPRGVGLCHELGLARHLHGTNDNARRTYVMRGGTLYRLPEGLSGLVPSHLAPLLSSNLLSPLGRLRMALDYVIPPRRGSNDESLAAFVRRRFGTEAYERMIEPLMSGIYGGNGDQLSLAATFPNLRKAEVEDGSLIRSMRSAASKREQNSTKTPAFLTLEKGIQELVDAITARLGAVGMCLQTRVMRIVHSSIGYQVFTAQGDALAADAVILATPAFSSADLMQDIDPVAAKVLREIPYGSTVTVSFAYRLEQIPRQLDGYGYIVPRSEGRPVLACTWTSTKFLNRAPQGFALIRAFLGRAGQDEIVSRSDNEVVKLVCDEMRSVLGITSQPYLQRIFRWPQGMPQYTLGHLERVNTIEQHVRACPGLYIAGSAYRGVGIPDCIASGEQAAEKALTFLSVNQSTEAVE